MLTTGTFEKPKVEAIIKLAKEKGYSKEAVRIIGTTVCSTQAHALGYTSVEGLKIAKEYCEKYDNERDCINALLTKMNIVED